MFSREDQYSNKRWKQVQYLSDVFWKRWTREYLLLLQERMKWRSFRRNLSVGDIVLVVDDSSPRCLWPLGRVLELFPNKHDGCVRVARVKTNSGPLLRPINNCVYWSLRHEQLIGLVRLLRTLYFGVFTITFSLRVTI